MQKVFLYLSFLVITSVTSFAQETKEETPVYLRFPTIPQFKLSKAADSTEFTRDDLKKRVNTLFFLFSPECGHCKHETEEIIRNIKKFKDAQIIMITYFPWNEMMPFYHHYKIANYPQITMARDNNYYFPAFFNIKNFPSTYLYDKKGIFKKSFEGAVKIEDILKEL